MTIDVAGFERHERRPRGSWAAEVSAALDWVVAGRPESRARIEADPDLAAALSAVVEAGPWLARICVHEPAALDVLADLDRPVPTPVDTEPLDRVGRLKDLGLLRIAARDLLGQDGVEEVGHQLSELAGALISEAIDASRRSSAGMAVVALGKLGARELNYASDIDLVLVGPESGQVDPRPFLELARRAWRVDLDLRPEGRAGPMVRTLSSYDAYWSRWADAWEFQALLKARPVGGDPDLGGQFAAAAASQVWGRPFGAEELRQLRRMKGRAETELLRRNVAEREIKRGPGGIRDIEFAVQLLQLVHGRSDESLRAPATLDALKALAAGGYVSGEDADALASAYRFLRTVEHRLQLYEGQPVYTLPSGPDRRAHLAVVMGYRPDGRHSAEQQFEADLRSHRMAARSIHERLFFRPLLEAFTSGRAGPLAEGAVTERLAAFGFAEPARTAQAVAELTRGFSRMSQLMQRMLPLLLDWLSSAPDPDQGLLGLRVLAGAPPSRDRLVTVCRESPTAARQLCQLLGSGPRFARDFQHHPDSLGGLAAGTFPAPRSADDLKEQAVRSLAWRSGESAAESGLRQLTQAETLRIAARDVLEMDGTSEVGRALSDLADSVIAAALHYLSPAVPFAVIGMGRLGGREIGYGSDVDLLIVWDEPAGSSADEGQAAAETAALALTRLIGGASPATGAYRVDLRLRPEGRQGPLARSLAAYEAYYDKWAEPWERQALLRGRFLSGDPGIGAAFAELAERFVWARPLAPSDVVAIRRTKARIEKERVPPGEDPKFHLKLGPGSISDVEWTVQLLQLRSGLPETNTMAALDLLVEAGTVGPADAAVLSESYRFCVRTRNRLSLVRDLPGESLPVPGPALTTLARSLGFSASGLRNEYTRVTRRARRVVERLFYEA